MTLSELQASTKDFLIPEDVADLIGCKPYSINVQAKADPSKLGFPVSLIGTRVKIPRLGFLYWMQYGTTGGANANEQTHYSPCGWGQNAGSSEIQRP